MDLVNLETYCSFPNIHPGNNVLRYSPDERATCHIVALSTGSYSIEDISNEIQRQLRLNGHKAKILLGANTSTLSATLTLARNYQVDFDVDQILSWGSSGGSIHPTGPRTVTPTVSTS